VLVLDTLLRGPTIGNPAIPGDTITDLGVLPRGRISVAPDIDATGAVVGRADTAAREAHAFLYQSSNLRDLGAFAGKNSAADDVNAGGDVAGGAQT
jgi:probable HAF family extracellular repeat protein